MRNRNKIIRTTDRELYEKLNMLHFSNEVIIKNGDKKRLSRILNNVNKNSKTLEFETIGNYTILRKLKPVNFNVYLK